MLPRTFSIWMVALLSVLTACNDMNTEKKAADIQTAPGTPTGTDILGNPAYPAISYGGYRQDSRQQQPTVEMLKEDLKILSALGVRLLRTYNVQLPHAPNVLKAIRQLREEDPTFEMYVMLGAWIDCKNAWTGKTPDHNVESEQNKDEIARAVALAQQYPEMVKIVAVGNEAMVKWAESYYVQPGVILKWVRYLQGLKKSGALPETLLITSSDNFASWGGGDAVYHVPDLEALVAEVDFISLHTYPMHDTHYHPVFWGVEGDTTQSKKVLIEEAMARALAYAQQQYQAVANYVDSLGVSKPIHIGETGWASFSSDFYGPDGSRATDEYKAGLYYRMMRDWTQSAGISCFYFEAFDEPWKDAAHPDGSENHFGLFTVDGQAKYAVWDEVGQGAFEGLTRGGNPIRKTHDGQLAAVIEQASVPPLKATTHEP